MNMNGELDVLPIEVFVISKFINTHSRLYYQYKGNRLPVCTLPIHSLLHISADIRAMGPVWCYWNFVTERFCGSLLPAISSRKHPFTSLAHRVRDVAQLNQIKIYYSLTDVLDLSSRKAVEETGTRIVDCEYNIQD